MIFLKNIFKNNCKCFDFSLEDDIEKTPDTVNINKPNNLNNDKNTSCNLDESEIEKYIYSNKNYNINTNKSYSLNIEESKFENLSVIVKKGLDNSIDSIINKI